MKELAFIILDGESSNARLLQMFASLGKNIENPCLWD